MDKELVWKIAIPTTHHDGFDYLPCSDQAQPGALVYVPFRKVVKLGVLISKSYQPPGKKLKTALEINHKFIVTKTLLRLCCWVSNYYHSPLSEVLGLLIPAKYRDDKPYSQQYYAESFYKVATQNKILPKSASKLRSLYSFVAAQNVVAKSALTKAGFTKAQINNLLAKNLFEVCSAPQQKSLIEAVELNLQQQEIAAEITFASYQCFYLYGVTGSGKTEIYLSAIKKVISQGKQALFLVPEIGLTPQMLDRIRKRIVGQVAVLHSNVTPLQRARIFESEAQVIIGTRLAVLAPLKNLGIIIIDEEHDLSYKQTKHPGYHARDVALMRAYFNNIPIILGSATPSLESFYNCLKNKYKLLQLHHKALSSSKINYDIIDMRNQKYNAGIAVQTLGRISEHLQKNQQVMIFVNRRGYAPLLLCHNCGQACDCRACDVHLTYHKNKARLICHHCGLSYKKPTFCKKCNSQDFYNLGSGTQRIVEYLQSIYPKKQVLQFDRDEIKNNRDLCEKLNLIHDNKAQIIVGTQMLAKGHHFPKLSLVVILDADGGFYSQDFRALERLGQTFTQVAGRAGREKIAGQVVIQTHLPHHPLLHCLIKEDYLKFSAKLLELRAQALLPPYSYLALIKARAKNHLLVHSFLKELTYKSSEVTIYGPIDSLVAYKAYNYHMQLLLKSPKRNTLAQSLRIIREKIATLKGFSAVKWTIDVDPQEL